MMLTSELPCFALETDNPGRHHDVKRRFQTPIPLTALKTGFDPAATRLLPLLYNRVSGMTNSFRGRC
jgi:hypothetical protein